MADLPMPFRVVPDAEVDESKVPRWLRKETPAISEAFVVDARIQLVPFLAALANSGYTAVNLKDGRLMITARPEDVVR